MKPLRHALLTLALTAVTLGTASCQGALTDDEQVIGEATSYLTAAEETGELAGDAAGAEEGATLESLADDSSALPPVSSDSDGVCDFGARRARILARYDADGDGQLGPAERQQLKSDLQARVGHPFAVRFAIAHRIHVLKRVKWVFDENGDGALSADERTALVDAMQARCERLHAAALERFDADGDGKLSAEEKQAAKAALVARLQAAREALLAQYDTNGNGVLDDGERLALRADRIAAFQAKKAEVVAHFDTNGDGKLDDAEKLALKKAIQQRIIEGRDAE
jgi:Ca2+-binding EF-hand superfamily protein